MQALLDVNASRTSEGFRKVDGLGLDCFDFGEATKPEIVGVKALLGFSALRGFVQSFPFRDSVVTCRLQACETRKWSGGWRVGEAGGEVGGWAHTPWQMNLNARKGQGEFSKQTPKSGKTSAAGGEPTWNPMIHSVLTNKYAGGSAARYQGLGQRGYARAA